MNWESILGIITHPIVVTIITSVAGIAIAGFARYKKAFDELIDIPRSVLAARKPKSAGGKSITKDEYAAIGKEIVDFVQELGKLYPRSK